MKKTYETPVCQAIIASDEDILTTSTTEYVDAKVGDGTGDFDHGGIIYW